MELTEPIRVARQGGLGDSLMCTPALRELKRTQPTRPIHFYCHQYDLLQAVPYLDSTFPVSEVPSDAIWLNYDHALDQKVHYAKTIGDVLGVTVSDVRPDCPLDLCKVAELERQLAGRPRPYIAIQRRASEWTPNRNWPGELWDVLLEHLLRIGTIVEIGRSTDVNTHSAHANYLDLRNTPLPELIASLAVVDLLVGPDSGPIHVAAAVRTPAVVIMGGYLLPEQTAYRGNTVLHTPLSCAPCFLRNPCALNLECLRAITPETVLSAVSDLLLRSAAMSGSGGGRV